MTDYIRRRIHQVLLQTIMSGPAAMLQTVKAVDPANDHDAAVANNKAAQYHDVTFKLPDEGR